MGGRTDWDARVDARLADYRCETAVARRKEDLMLNNAILDKRRHDAVLQCKTCIKNIDIAMQDIHQAHDDPEKMLRECLATAGACSIN